MNMTSYTSHAVNALKLQARTVGSRMIALALLTQIC